MRVQELFILISGRVDGACCKSAEVMNWEGGRMNVQDTKANKTPFTQDHEPLGNVRLNVQKAREIPIPATLTVLKSVCLSIYLSTNLFNGISIFLFSFTL